MSTIPRNSSGKRQYYKEIQTAEKLPKNDMFRGVAYEKVSQEKTVLQ